MPRYRLRIAYDGTDFHGWQKQLLKTDEGPHELRTVQGVMETAVASVVREPVHVVGASRTDTGVHAVGQVAAFSAARELDPPKLRAAINARLPADVQVRAAEVVDEAFSPISQAIAKGYRYRIAWGRGGSGGAARPLFDRRYTFWTPYRLHPGRMNEAARRLLGRHDFSSFTRKHHNRESTVRTVFECKVDARRRRRLTLDIAGDGFLYNMVRIVAGTLVEVGRGRIEPSDVDRILEARDRTAAGPTLPPEGLCLRWIRYEAKRRSDEATK